MNLSLFCFERTSGFTFTSVGNFIRGAVSKVKEGFETEGAAEGVAEGADVGTAEGTTEGTTFGAKVSSIDLR
jgi:hypothetical protein